LKGVRFAVASEADSNRRFSEALIKRLTGGDTRIGARLHGSSYEYQPTDKLWFLTNHLPAIKDATVGMWERVRVIPFNRQFLGEDQDRGLEPRLQAEREGIFSWMVEGAYRYLQRGRLPEVPKVCAEAVAEYRDDNDALSRFIREVGRKELGATVGVQEAHKALDVWCFENKEEPVSIKFFRKNMAERGIRSKDTKKGFVFLDFSLKKNGVIDVAKPIADNDDDEWTIAAIERKAFHS
jgi:putative DNA primase/helicase